MSIFSLLPLQSLSTWKLQGFLYSPVVFCSFHLFQTQTERKKSLKKLELNPTHHFFRQGLWNDEQRKRKGKERVNKSLNTIGFFLPRKKAGYFRHWQFLFYHTQVLGFSSLSLFPPLEKNPVHKNGVAEATQVIMYACVVGR